MSWAALGSNHLISGANLKSAVDTNYAILKVGQTIPNDDNILNRSEIEQRVHVTVSNTPASNQCPCKSDCAFTSTFPCGTTASNNFLYEGLGNSTTEACGYYKYYDVDLGTTSGLVTINFANFSNFPAVGVTMRISHWDGTNIVATTTFYQASTYQFNYTYNAAKGTTVRFHFGWSCP